VFFSLGITTNSTRTFIQKLEHYNKLCLIPTDRDNALALARNLDDGFLAIFITLSGNTEILIQCANLLKQKGINIISITGLENNYIHKQTIIQIPLLIYNLDYILTSC